MRGEGQGSLPRQKTAGERGQGRGRVESRPSYWVCLPTSWGPPYRLPPAQPPSSTGACLQPSSCPWLCCPWRGFRCRVREILPHELLQKPPGSLKTIPPSQKEPPSPKQRDPLHTSPSRGSPPPRYIPCCAAIAGLLPREPHRSSGSPPPRARALPSSLPSPLCLRAALRRPATGAALRRLAACVLGQAPSRRLAGARKGGRPMTSS